MPAPPPSRRALPRRAVLGGLVAALASTAGCAPAAPGGAATPDASAGGRRRPREVTPDVAVAITAAARVREMAGLVDRAVRHHPSLRHRLAALATLHATHLRLLTNAVPAGHRTEGPTDGGGRVPHRAGAAVDAVVRGEHGLQSGLETLAVQAQSGEFARLLAAMSAAIGQQLAVLAEAPAGAAG